MVQKYEKRLKREKFTCFFLSKKQNLKPLCHS
nr:MAG TPA: hypothetical protein [Caudoviricetes sp.]